MNRERELEVCLDRLGYFPYEISRWNRALVAVQKGIPFQKAVKEEVYIEERLRRNRAFHALTIMTEHLLLLKMKFYTEDRPHDNWGNMVKTSQSEAAAITEWNKKERDTVLTEYLSGALQEIYEAGVKRYHKVSDRYPSRKDRPQTIPGHCPWTLEELVNGTAEELLEHLPD